MSGIFGNDFRLQRENERLKRELARAKADIADLQHENTALKEDVAQWKAYGHNLGAYGQQINDNLRHISEQVQCLAQGQERNQTAVMADLQSLSDALDAQGQTIQAEAQEVKTKLDEQNALILQLQQNTNDPAKVQELADKIQANSDQVRAIFTGEPAPAPGSRRR